MKGQIMIYKADDRRWIFVPEKNIQFDVCEGGKHGLIICAFRTDGYHHNNGNPIPTSRWLRENAQFTTELEVPDEVVHFAVRSERERQMSVENIEALLKRGLRNPKSLRWSQIQEALRSPAPSAEADELLEYKLALQIQKLLQEQAGLQ